MNSVQLVGRLTKDPQISYTSQTNTAVAVFILAVDRPTKEKQTDFPRVKVYGKQAENVEKYVHKGSMVGISGSIETGSYEKDGNKVYFTDVIASRVEFISNGKKQAENANKAASDANNEQHDVEEQIDGFEAIDEDVPF